VKHREVRIAEAALGAAGLLAAIGMVLAALWGAGPSVAPVETVRMAELDVPDPETLAAMAELGPRLEELSRPPSSAPKPADLKIFGYRLPEPPPSRKTRREKPESVMPDLSLTFTFASGNRRFCLIEGRFCAEGALLPEGYKVLRIEVGRVLLEKGSVRAWLRQTPPDRVELKSGPAPGKPAVSGSPASGRRSRGGPRAPRAPRSASPGRPPPRSPRAARAARRSRRRGR